MTYPPVWAARERRSGKSPGSSSLFAPSDAVAVSRAPQPTTGWSTPPPLAPYVTVEFSPDGCRQCPAKAVCTRTDARKVTFLPRDLYPIQSESRTEQQTQEWLSRYSLRAAIESTISKFVNGNGTRQCRYRSQDKATSSTY